MIKYIIMCSIIFNLFSINIAHGKKRMNSMENLSVKLEELNVSEFKLAVQKSKSTCIIPIGVLEKHGPHLPLGTDLINVREIAFRAAEKEYTIIFPEYYFSQINEAKHQPGTIAYSHDLIWKLLQETCDELSRNGIKKIIIVNGHGGNKSFLKYFCQIQLESSKDYVLFLFTPTDDSLTTEKINKLRKTNFDSHAGELETSTMMAHRPDLVNMDIAKTQDGQNQNRLNDLKDTYVGIWWYSKFPNHYAGDGSAANAELGEILIKSEVAKLVKMIQYVKNDDKVLELQKRFFNESEKPLNTGQ